MKEKQWIEKIAPDATRAANEYGYLPSVLIAQTCQETGYGSTDLSQEGIYNTVGMKKELLNDTWESNHWYGKTYTKVTPEWYDGVKTYITDVFRMYGSYYDGLADYCQFMRDAKYSRNGKYKYRDLLGDSDPYALIEGVRSRGYCTDPEYTNAVMGIIKKHNLTQYDGGKKMDINREYITTNCSYSNNDPEYIVIHNTDNFSPGANAKAHASGLKNGDITGMSWHYVVDDSDIAYQCLEHDRGAFHVGKNYGSGNLYGKVTNRNSICIEICVQKGYDYEKSFENAVKLTKKLMAELSIPAERVVTHHTVCSKNCPSQILAHGDWDRFKKEITAKEKEELRFKVDIIKKGDSGLSVLLLQEILKARNYYKGTLTRIFDDNTESSVIAYQKDRIAAGAKIGGADGKPDGKVGVKTWTDLFGGLNG